MQGINNILSSDTEVGKNLIIKSAEICGVLPIVRKGKYKMEAERFLIDDIKKNKHLSATQKAVLICNVQKQIRDMSNQASILQNALNQIGKESNNNDIDDDWLANFFEKCKNISNESVQTIWGKLLADEYENSGKVSSAVVHTLSILDGNYARKFAKLCNFLVEIEAPDEVKQEWIIYDFNKNNYIFEECGIDVEEIFELQLLGLVQIETAIGYSLSCEKTKKDVFIIRYHNYELSLLPRQQKRYLKVGYLKLTNSGKILSQYVEKNKVNKYNKYLESYFEKECIFVV